MPDKHLKMPEITGRTQLIGVVGDPISQVRAPELLNPVLASRGLDAVVVPIHVPAGRAEDFIRGASAVPNLPGLIVTVPHKFQMAGLCAGLTDRARKANAINVMKQTMAGWEGDLLDGLGFVRGFQRQGYALEGKNIALTGAGGAGTAIAIALVEAGARSLSITDVSESRVQELMARLSGAGTTVTAGDGPTGDTDVAINATPCGLQPDDPLPFPIAGLPGHCVVADIIMKPVMTPLLIQAQAQGLAIHQGRHMLDAQTDLMIEFFAHRLQQSRDADPSI